MTFYNRLKSQRNVLINYATPEFRKSQSLNSASAITVGGLDYAIEYRPGDIDSSFRRQHERILSTRRGGGLWLWKPYFILKTLRKLRDGDVLFYCDSGAIFVDSALPLVLAAHQTGTVVCFDVGLPEQEWSKRDAYVLMDADEPRHVTSTQRLATFQVWCRSSQSIALAEQYLQYCCDYRIVSDAPSTCGLPEYPGFRENRHDQTVFSLLTKKMGISALRDPSVAAPPRRLDGSTESNYGKILHSTRIRHDRPEMRFRSRISTGVIAFFRWLQLRSQFQRVSR